MAFTMMTMLSFGVACYLYEISLASDLKCSLRSIDKESKKPKRNQQNLHAQFSEFIDIHSAAKQLRRFLFNNS